MGITDQEKILNYLKFTGPTTPSRISKNIKQELLFTSAHLSDLRSQGKIKISYLKIGGSPLYFLAGQEDQLYQNAPGNINQKDLEVLNILREKKILAEASLDLLGRVAIRGLKDFAIPLHVTLDGKTGLFWKWHLLSTEEASQLISEMVAKILNQSAPVQPKVEVQIPVPEVVNTSVETLKAEVVSPISPILEIKEKETEETKEKESKQKKEFKETRVIGEKAKKSIKKEEQKKIKEIEEEEKENLVEKSKINLEKEVKTIPNLKEIKPIETELKENKPIEKTEIQESLGKEIEEDKNKIKRKKKDIEEELLPIVEDFFNNLKINIEYKEILRKNAELNLLVIVPSVVGKIKYFCKVKNKAKCDEKDVSAAYMEAQMKKLPLLFIYTNEITKKAEEVLNSGAFDNILAKKIE